MVNNDSVNNMDDSGKIRGVWFEEFSNCYHRPQLHSMNIVVDGVEYRSTEHYYQSRKFRDPQSIELICKQPTPLKAKFTANKQLRKARRTEHDEVSQTDDTKTKKDVADGRLRRNHPGGGNPTSVQQIHAIPDNEWQDRKEAIMYEGTFAKYTQHRSLRDLLLSTSDDDELVEPNKNDEYWGCGRDGISGKNRLGHILMDVRGCLRRRQQQKQQRVQQNTDWNTNIKK